ncbi:MAG: alpha/beta fold hydrolase [Acidobacteriota bacterium]
MNTMDAPLWLDRDAYPFKLRVFNTREGRMHYVDEGAGEPIVFVHGNPSWSYMYRRQIQDLRSEFRCIAPDHLGFGLSDKPPGADYHPSAHAERFDRFMDAVESEPVHLVVHDWGGPIGMAWALAHPGRVKSLVVLNTWFWSLADSKAAQRFSGFLGSGPMQFLIRRLGLFEHLLMRHTFADKSKYRAAEKHYRRPFRSAADRVGVSSLPRHVIGASPWLDQLWQQRRVIADKPTSIFWALEDPVFRKDALERWRSLLPEASVEKIAGVGHYVAEEMGSELSPRLRAHIAAV